MADLNRARALLSCGLLAAVAWGVGAYFARTAPLAVAVPASDPTAFGAWAGSSAVRFAGYAGVLSRLFLIFGAFGLVVAIQRGRGARKVFLGALLVSLGQAAGIASSGVALFVYPRVAALVAEGRLEAVDVVGVMPMGAVTVSVLSTVSGSLLQAVGVWRNAGLPRWSGWLVAVGTVGSLVPGEVAGTKVAWLLILTVWLSGWAWMLWIQQTRAESSDHSRPVDPNTEDSPAETVET